MIRKEAWPFYRTISGVCLCWELEEPKGLEGRETSVNTNTAVTYRGTSLIRNIPRVGPYSSPMPRDLW